MNGKVAQGSNILEQTVTIRTVVRDRGVCILWSSAI